MEVKTIKTIVKKFIRASGYTILKIPNTSYYEDGLFSIHNHEFVDDTLFRRAYGRGVVAAGEYNWRWRVHIGLWAAYSASLLEGDFVECGVNRGFLSSAIMDSLDWDTLGKTFFLLDTFSGLDGRYVSDAEIRSGALQMNKELLESGFYVQGAESVQANFSQWKNVRIIPGSIPDTLNLVATGNVAYLHIDMNSAPPEVAAFDFFWERLVPGAFVLLDDYAYCGREIQKSAMDAAAANKRVKIASLPTGQGLLIKPTYLNMDTRG